VTATFFQLASALAALLSAVFWGLSAAVNLPAVMSYKALGEVLKPLRLVATLNMIAALFAAGAALAAAIGTLMAQYP
jgi:hypothetical protein